MQMILQDSYASLNPHHTIGRIIGEPMRVDTKTTKPQIEERLVELLDLVGLRPAHRTRYAHEFSGGQRHHINIARALALSPDLIVADEPVSALDVSIQAQVINRFADLQEELGVAYLFVAHDLSMVQHISDRVAVMCLGHIVELAETENLFESTLHPHSAGAAVSRAGAGPRVGGHSAPRSSRRGGADPGFAAIGLRVLHSLPPGCRPLSYRGAGPSRDHLRPLGGVSPR